MNVPRHKKNAVFMWKCDKNVEPGRLRLLWPFPMGETRLLRWPEVRSQSEKVFFLVFWTRTFMIFIIMIKHNVQFELFDFCMRFWKWNLGGTHHNIGNAVQYRAHVTGESEELKGKWLFFVIGESEELKEKLLSFVTGKRESENIKKKVNLMQCESERCVNVVDVRGQAWCAAVIQSQLVDKL